MRAASLVCTVAVLAIAAGAGTARADEPRVEFGIRAGLNLASVNGDDVSFDNVSPENRVAVSGGLFAGIRVTPSFLIQPEVLYTQKGARYEAAGEEAELRLDYVEVPVLLKGRSRRRLRRLHDRRPLHPGPDHHRRQPRPGRRQERRLDLLGRVRLLNGKGRGSGRGAGVAGRRYLPEGRPERAPGRVAQDPRVSVTDRVAGAMATRSPFFTIE
jgi:hypothetical protein